MELLAIIFLIILGFGIYIFAMSVRDIYHELHNITLELKLMNEKNSSSKETK